MDSPIGFTVKPLPSSAGTYDVNFTTSDLGKGTAASYTRSTTTLTVTHTNHGLTTNDSYVIAGDTDFEGTHAIASVTNDNVFTITVADSGAAAGNITGYPLQVDDVTDFTAASGTNSGNISASVSAIRLDASSATTAALVFEVNQA
jgi:hypothetical protein